MTTHEEREKRFSIFSWISKNKELSTTVTVGIAIIGFLNGKFEKTDKRIEKIEERLAVVEKDITMIKTVMILNHMMPEKLCDKEEKK